MCLNLNIHVCVHASTTQCACVKRVQPLIEKHKSQLLIQLAGMLATALCKWTHMWDKKVSLCVWAVPAAGGKAIHRVPRAPHPHRTPQHKTHSTHPTEDVCFAPKPSPPFRHALGVWVHGLGREYQYSPLPTGGFLSALSLFLGSVLVYLQDIRNTWFLIWFSSWYGLSYLPLGIINTQVWMPDMDINSFRVQAVFMIHYDIFSRCHPSFELTHMCFPLFSLSE